MGDAWRAANERRGRERHHVVLLVLLGAASFFDSRLFLASKTTLPPAVPS